MNDTIKKLAQEWKEADAEYTTLLHSEGFTRATSNAWDNRAKCANVLAMAVAQELWL